MSSFSPNQLRQCTRMTGAQCGPDKEQQLRDQIHNELAKIKYCANPSYECSQMRIEGSDYCIRHILRDPRGNYRQCSHVYPNGRKCLNAVAKFDNKKEQILTTLCFEHNRQTQLQKTHLAVGRLRTRVETNETLLNSLAHHVNVDDIKPEVSKPEPDDDEIDVVSPYVVPFVNQDHRNSIGHIISAVRKRRRILDYASDSSSQDEDPPCLRNTAKDLEFYESDYESVDSEDDDPLKHAGVYTRAEAVRIGEAKLIKLKRLYQDQLDHLQLVLRQQRRKYLHDIRRERETYCSIHDQLKETPHERQLYEKLKALNSYHRRQGVEAVLYKKLKEKRLRDTVLTQKSSSTPKCVFTEGGVKCGERTLPCCKYCRKHILEDKRQVLFRACGVERSGVVCQEPVASILEDSSCVLHLTVPTAKRQYIQKFYEMPTVPPVDSIFQAGHGSGDGGDVNGFVEENNSNQMMVERAASDDEFFDLTAGIFDFDVSTAEDLAKSLDDGCAFLLDIAGSELGLELGENSNLDGTNLELGDIENVPCNAMPVDSPYTDVPLSPCTDIEDIENQDPNAMPKSNLYAGVECTNDHCSNAPPIPNPYSDVEFNDNQDPSQMPISNLYSDLDVFIENPDPCAMALDCPYSNTLDETPSSSAGVCQDPQSFEIDDTTNSVSEVLKILEGMEQMPWFDALLD